jgi:prepilin-type N-terminal cleavage/methylation domain-containing protein
MAKANRGFSPSRKGGFSLIEALIGIAVLGIAVLGLAQIFLLGISNNKRSGDISQATFLAQGRIEYLRSLTADELNSFPSTARGESADETVDSNGDGTPEFRRITQVQSTGLSFNVKILVFPAARLATPLASLIADPWAYKVRALVNTVISR